MSSKMLLCSERRQQTKAASARSSGFHTPTGDRHTPQAHFAFIGAASR